MSWSGIEPQFPGLLANTFTIMLYMNAYMSKERLNILLNTKWLIKYNWYN